jgi:hypothetical protein
MTGSEKGPFRDRWHEVTTTRALESPTSPKHRDLFDIAQQNAQLRRDQMMAHKGGRPCGHEKAECSELPSTCQAHDILRIIRLSDCAQPRHVPTIYLFQRRPGNGIVHIGRRVRQVLAVLDSGTFHGRGRCAYGITHVLVDRFVSPRAVDTRWKDGRSAVGRIGGRTSMCEEVGVVGAKNINDHYARVVLAQFLAPELYNERG